MRDAALRADRHVMRLLRSSALNDKSACSSRLDNAASLDWRGDTSQIYKSRHGSHIARLGEDLNHVPDALTLETHWAFTSVTPTI